IMGMMSLVLLPGTIVTVDAEGDDEEKAVESIENFLSR
ncbi:MAG: HPr family phosphocarrier protein, partial [Firmicutes bacterium]|nr:HPr family phosphocarrier protein [Bacillota bacterium]